jgi:hypothetical protein
MFGASRKYTRAVDVITRKTLITAGLSLFLVVAL